jgi:NAD(P)-dependent dehydrogenase (short-subunit alcohol dehydrogenase family)
MNIQNASVIVAGGGSGLGRACAEAYAADGARVAIIDLNPASAPVGGLVEIVDICETEPLEAALDRIAAADGPPRVLINCAGLAGGGVRISSRHGPHPLDLFERHMRVHALGSFNIMRLIAARMSAAPPLEDGERGLIIQTSSLVAADGPVGMVAYAAAKAAIEAMILPSARDLGPMGIRVNCISAGNYDTPMTEGMPEALKERNNAMQPFPKRMGRPSEFALLARHMAENRMINGVVYRLDGGLRLHVSG